MEKIKTKFTLLNLVRRTGASMLFLGYFPFASGTVASAATIAGIWYLNSRYPLFFTPAQIMYYWAAMICVVGVSIFLSSQSKEVFGDDDPSPVVIDELAGQFITFFMIPISIKTLILGFVLFRFFDIVKPFPVYKMEEMDGGSGITMDDVAAGVYANITLMTILALYTMVKAHL